MLQVIRVTFDGVASCTVPDHLSPKDAQLLARKIILANVLATLNGNDKDPEEDSIDSYKKECSSEALGNSEFDWEDSRLGDISGRWFVQEFHEPEIPSERIVGEES